MKLKQKRSLKSTIVRETFTFILLNQGFLFNNRRSIPLAPSHPQKNLSITFLDFCLSFTNIGCYQTTDYRQRDKVNCMMDRKNFSGVLFYHSPHIDH